ANLRARRTVALILVRYGLLPRAIDILVAGTKYQPDLDYLKLMFGWMLEAEQDDRVVALAQEMLPPQPDASLLHRFVALQAATARYAQGRYDEAETLVQ